MKDLFSKPNQITFIRILLIPIFVLFLLSNLPYKDYIAAFIFIALSVSDALDGYIARKHGQVTDIGKIIDPIADKLLISAALFFLIGRIQIWMAVIIIVRELVITAARIILLPKKVVMPASNLGKIKTISQIVAIVSVMLSIPFNWWLMLLAVIITVVSGLDYFIKIGKIMGEDVLNLPNIITTFRLLLVPLFVINLYLKNMNFALIVAAIIILADKLDGVFARITDKSTRFGKLYDLFTDFTFMLSSGIAFVAAGLIEFYWLVVFLIPSSVLLITKMAHYSKFKKPYSPPVGKIVVGLAYAGGVAVIIDFVYSYQMLVLMSVMVYIYMLFDLYRLFKTLKKPRFF